MKYDISCTDHMFFRFKYLRINKHTRYRVLTILTEKENSREREVWQCYIVPMTHYVALFSKNSQKPKISLFRKICENRCYCVNTNNFGAISSDCSFLPIVWKITFLVKTRSDRVICDAKRCFECVFLKTHVSHIRLLAD